MRIAAAGLGFIYSTCIEITDRQENFKCWALASFGVFFLQCLTAASDGNRQRAATEASPSSIAVLMLDLTMGYLATQEYMDSWILATAKFMFLSLESEALDPEDLGARWSSLWVTRDCRVFLLASFQPALAVFCFHSPSSFQSGYFQIIR